MGLGTVKERDKLKPQREPYWQKLAARQHLGFRPSTAGKGGTWIARFYDPESGKKPIWSYQDLVDTRSAASIHRLILVRADAA